MVKITLEVEGMACGMCEAHVNDAIRKAFPVKKVTSSHTKGKTEILAENPFKGEYFLPVVADRLIRGGKADVKMLCSRIAGTA